MNNFVLIGASGYIAPRHMKAIKDTGNKLVAALDPCDSVGVIDSFFPDADFFTEFERFDRHIDKLRRIHKKIDFVTVCSPNYLHDAHIRFGLRNEANVICEKPIVLNPWNVEALKLAEKEFDKKIYSILQLRLHPNVITLKNEVENSPSDKTFDVDLTYLTSRGNWYYTSWKGQHDKSGGIATNIGIHFFDLLTWIFGDVQENIVHIHSHDRASGYLQLKKARIRWFLGINPNLLPKNIREKGERSYRSLFINNEEFDLNGGFTELHTQSYKEIIRGNGFRISETEKSISLVHEIRNQKPVGLKGEYHPLAKKKLASHPFHKGK